MRIGRRQGVPTSRLMAVALFLCALTVPLTAHADPSEAGGPRIILGSQPPLGPEGYNTFPIVADVLAESPGTLWYRFGSGPGPWTEMEGPIAVPEGKQLLSTVLVSPDGMASPVSSVVLRSDFSVRPLAGAGSSGNLNVSAEASEAGSASAADSVAVRVIVRATLTPVIGRVGSSDRYDSAAAIAAAGFKSAQTVILATGEKFPDALTASGLAGAMKSPILLVRRDSVPPRTTAQIKALGAKRVIICGGTPSVTKKVEKQLRAKGLKVERLAGKDRYGTAVAIANRIKSVKGKPSRVFIARGDTFPDALSVAPMAYSRAAPILLTWPYALQPDTKKQLARSRYPSARIAGSTASVNPKTEKAVRRLVRDVGRWGGSTRYSTSLICATRGVLEGTNSWSYVGVASFTDYPDALCGGVVAGARRGVIAMTAASALDGGLADTLEAHMGDIRTCEVYGGVNAVAPTVFDQIRTILH